MSRTIDRLPPGQSVTKKWPVLSYGATPDVPRAGWRLSIRGEVEEPLDLTWDDLLALPQETVRADFHCVTGWSRFDNVWEGVRFVDLFPRARPRQSATHASLFCYGGYTTSLPLASLLAPDALLAHRHDGRELSPEHGGPARVVVPGRYAYKSAKWIAGIALLDHDEPGFWEVRGYHNDADPWREERYSF